MLDPIPAPPAALSALIKPFADYFSFHTLPLHIHEVLLSFILYQGTQSVLSPWLSRTFFSKYYLNFNERTRVNWDVHVVSLLQSVLVCGVALWVMWTDTERWNMDSPQERVFGYTGACGLVQGMAAGYFLWDIVVSTVHWRIFGVGLWFHAVSALWVFSLGFKPFINFYAPTFILYELSSPFLNFHWFFDKVNMTGSNAQWYNGMLLLSSFFCCRLIWGTWQSVVVFSDIYQVLTDSTPGALNPVTGGALYLSQPKNIAEDIGALCTSATCMQSQAEVLRFANITEIPAWLGLTYLVSNLILNALNWYWFSKMVGTVLKRFRTPAAETEKKSLLDQEGNVKVGDLVVDAAGALQDEHSGEVLVPAGILPEGVDEKIASAVEGVREEARKRRVMA